MKKNLCSFLILLCLSGALVFAEDSPPQATDVKKYEETQKRIQEIQLKSFERMQKDHPEMYKARKESMGRQAKIKEIVSLFRQGTITLEQAESQLRSLVREDVQDAGKNLDSKIKRLEKTLEFYKKAKNDPNFLVQKRLDEILGKIKPSPEEFY